MKIIKHSDFNKVFECYCGCIFEASIKEYRQKRDIDYYDKIQYECDCPECGDTCYLKSE